MRKYAKGWRNTRWTLAEDKLLRDYAANDKTAQETADALKRTRMMVCGRAKRLGITFGGEGSHAEKVKRRWTLERRAAHSLKMTALNAARRAEARAKFVKRREIANVYAMNHPDYRYQPWSAERRQAASMAKRRAMGTPDGYAQFCGLLFPLDQLPLVRRLYQRCYVRLGLEKTHEAMRLVARVLATPTEQRPPLPTPKRPYRDNGMAKITVEQVREIRRLLDAGATTKQLGPRYGLHPSQVSRIHTRKRWAHIE